MQLITTADTGSLAVLVRTTDPEWALVGTVPDGGEQPIYQEVVSKLGPPAIASAGPGLVLTGTVLA
jgi:hypothetical protein